MNTFILIVQALSIAIQFAQNLPPLIAQFQQLFPGSTPAQNQQVAARTLARTMMLARPELVNGTTEEFLGHALTAVAAHMVDDATAKQNEAAKSDRPGA